MFYFKNTDLIRKVVDLDTSTVKGRGTWVPKGIVKTRTLTRARVETQPQRMQFDEDPWHRVFTCDNPVQNLRSRSSSPCHSRPLLAVSPPYAKPAVNSIMKELTHVRQFEPPSHQYTTFADIQAYTREVVPYRPPSMEYALVLPIYNHPSLSTHNKPIRSTYSHTPPIYPSSPIKVCPTFCAREHLQHTVDSILTCDIQTG